jgi:predicted nucleic acid-binding protein
MFKFLYDASSLIEAIKLRRLDLLVRNYVQWLTYYEVLNALWKEVCLTRTLPLDRAFQLVALIKRVINYMDVLDVEGLEEEIFRVAVKLELTAYDASYVVLAQKHGLILVSEDEKLRSTAQRVVKSISVEELLRNNLGSSEE